METFIKADIFFFITTVAIVILTLLIALFLMYGISFSRNLYLLSQDIRKEGEAIIGVVGKIRNAMTDRGINAIAMIAKTISSMYTEGGLKSKGGSKTRKSKK